MLNKEYEVQVHFENGGSFSYRKKFLENEDPQGWLNANCSEYKANCFMQADDGRSILINMNKVLAIVLIPPQQLQQEQPSAASEVQE